MRCPYCQSVDSRVLESRLLEGETTLRRRRECGSCKNRFTTYERVETAPLVVVKRDGTREQFDANKIVKGLLRATVKCPVPLREVEQIAHDIEAAIGKRNQREVAATEIGEMVLARLREINEVAYVRFASVYRSFSSIEDFMRELAKLSPDEKSAS
ncbi:MAG: transcriptional repressor NrdR [Candidatus Sericytochromatia bacterium]|nr:transcriptional repressor NrdR [Candidatus Tanganyikabacteria bacterium]